MWEYKTVAIKGTLFTAKNAVEEINNLLNEMSAQNWELVNIYGYGIATCIAVFKRLTKPNSL